MTVQISVIVPVYRLSRMAQDCVLSLRSQQIDAEFLVLDDGSPDDSLARIVAAADGDSRFRILKNDQNRGLAFSLGRLLQAARGEFIAYMDGDDLALPGKLAALARHLEEHPKCSLAYHEAEVFDDASGKTLYLYSRDHYNASYIPASADLSHLIRYGCFLNASAVMFRAHRRMAEISHCACRILLDYPMHLFNLACRPGSVDFLPEVLGRYRLHSQSACGQNASSPERRLQVLADQLNALALLEPFDADPRHLALGRCHHRFAAALFFLKQKRDELFRRLIHEAASEGVFFDERHRFAQANASRPEHVRKALGFS